MKPLDYEKLLAQITPLDLSDLTRLEADLTKIVNRRQAENTGPRRSLTELAAQAEKSLKGLDQDKYWAEREEELTRSRDSWADADEPDQDHSS